MRSSTRSLIGLLIAAALVPVLAGILGCLPVPISDPERSRIDPDLTGLWVEVDEDPGLLMLEPFDERTWLVTHADLVLEPGEACADLEAQDPYEGVIRALEAEHPCLSMGGVELYKAWRSEHGGRGFLTMEPKGLITERGAAHPFEPEFWLVARIDPDGVGRLSLRLIDEDFDGFHEVPETPEAYAEVVALHADDGELYEADSRWQRVRAEHVRLFADLLRTVLHSAL